MNNSGPILVVDDDPQCLLHAQAEFNKAGVLTVCVKDLLSARHELARRKFAGACIDMRLGNDNGLSVISEIVSDAVNIPVVIVSQFRTLMGAVTALKLGAKDFLPKPCEAKKILNSLFSEDSPEHLLESITSDQYSNNEINLGDPVSLEVIENEHLRRVLNTEGNVAQAARILKVHRTTLFRKRHLWDEDDLT